MHKAVSRWLTLCLFLAEKNMEIRRDKVKIECREFVFRKQRHFK